MMKFLLVLLVTLGTFACGDDKESDTNSCTPEVVAIASELTSDQVIELAELYGMLNEDGSIAEPPSQEAVCDHFARLEGFENVTWEAAYGGTQLDDPETNTYSGDYDCTGTVPCP